MSDWAFGKSYGNADCWPTDENGKPVTPAFLEFLTGSEAESAMAVNLLEAYSIPVVCQYPNNGEFGRVILGCSGTGTALYVPETMLEDARNILSADITEELPDAEELPEEDQHDKP